MNDTVDKIKVKLIEEGYGGLYYDGECACEVDDLAPCGECDQSSGDAYINGCDPGYKHVDPKNEKEWAIGSNKEPPTDEAWERIRSHY